MYLQGLENSRLKRMSLESTTIETVLKLELVGISGSVKTTVEERSCE